MNPFDPNQRASTPASTPEVNAVRRGRRKLLSATLFAAAAAAILIAFIVVNQQDAHASKLGRVFFSGNPATNEGQNCAACHESDGGEASLTLSGPTEVESGQTYRFSATISGGPAVVGGLNVSAQDGLGSLAAIDDALQKIDVELSHTQPQPFENGELTFDFDWTAPDFATDLTMYAAGLSANGNVLLTGDSVGADTLAISVAGPQATATPAPTPPAADSVRFEPLAGGFDSATDLQHAGDARLFVTEQSGQILIIDGGSVLSQPFLDIGGRVADSSNEMGLLGLAFHPDYANNGYFYVNYTADSPRRTIVSRFSVTGNANVADPNSELKLLEFNQPASNHNGGQIRFGPDGYLYISSGDGGGGGDPFETGQDNTSMLGKLLRIDVDQASGSAPDCRGAAISGNYYTVPADNPFADGAGGSCDEIWATGLRNPWRFSFDALTGDLWIGDVGQGAREEIDFQPVTSPGGENYGWDCYEGNQPFESAGCLDASNYVFPIYDYDRSGGSCSVTGGIVYRGQDYPSLQGQYIFADFCRADLWSLRPANGNPGFTEFSVTGGNGLSSPVAFGEDARGELYVVSRAGTIYQIQTDDVAPTPTPIPPTSTPAPPTATSTPVPPTATPTNTAAPAPTSTPTTAPSQQAVTSLVLVNADTGQDVRALVNGDVVDLAALGTGNLSVRAETQPATVGSVRFGLNDNANFHVENFVPYALLGDFDGGQGYFAWTPDAGSYTLTATPFSGRSTGGTAGTPLSVTFSVVEDGSAPPTPEPGSGALSYSAFLGNWSQLPNFNALQPAQSGATDDFDVGLAGRGDNFALRFSSCLTVDAAGAYTFYTNSDDGSQLFVDGQLVVNNDGLHAARERQGSVALDAGVHPLTVTFFEGTGKQLLDVRYSGPGLSKQPLTADRLSTDGCVIANAVPQPALTAERASVVGLLFVDSNGNAQPDAGEPTLADVTVTLLPREVAAPQEATPEDYTIRSGEDGFFSFANVPAGQYEIKVELPTGYEQNEDAPLTLDLAGGSSLELPSLGIVEAAPDVDLQENRVFVPLVQQ